MSAAPLPSAMQAVLAHFKGVRPNGKGYKALCPAHADDKQSLAIREGSKQSVVFHCHAGCHTDSILAAAKLTHADIMTPRPTTEGPTTPVLPLTRPRLIKSYDYTSLDGELLYQACRLEPKDFRARRPDPLKRGEWVWNLDGVDRVLYRAPEVMEAVAAEREIMVVEGEKDADALWELGLPATTNVGGANKWQGSYSQMLRGARVVVLPDNDEPGMKHAESVAADLYANECAVKVVKLPGLPVKGDVSDFLATNENALDDLAELVEKQPRWHPDPKNRTTFGLDEWEEHPEWLQPPPVVVPKLCYKGLSTLLYLEPKGGKSTLVRIVAGACSRGGKFLNEPCAEGTVLIVALEESGPLITYTFQKFPRDSRKIKIRKRFIEDTDRRVDELRAEIERLKPVLVIIDTLAAWARPTGKDMNRPEIEGVIAPLAALAGETDTAFLIIHHANRGANGEFSGHHMIAGACDIKAQMNIPNKDADPRTPLRTIDATGRVDKSFFTMRYTQTGYELAGSPATEMRAQVADWIRDNPGKSLTNLREGIRVVHGKADNNAVDSALSGLMRDGVVVNLGTTSKWRLALKGAQVDLGDEGTIHGPGTYDP